jgi:hypothetical protein
MTAAFRRRYGAGPLHLFAIVVAVALAGYAATRVLADGGPILAIGIWFVGAALAHDVVFYPLYALTDLAAHARVAQRHRPAPAVRGVPWINYVRMPAALSGLLLLIWFPLILGGRAQAFLDTTGIGTEVYLGRWLAVTGVLFLVSGVLYAWRVRRAAVPEPS